MDINFPPTIRKAIYVLVVMGTALLVPLHQFGSVSDLALAVWSSLSGAASLLAAFNVTK